MGHSGYLDSSYLRTNIAKAEEEYKQAIPKLTILSKPVDEVELKPLTLLAERLIELYALKM